MPPAPPAAPHRELTARAVAVAVLVAALMGATYPAIVLRIGYGPNISVVSAFLGYLILGLVGLATGSRGTRHEVNLVQTAGTSAGQAAFMAVVVYAIDLLDQKGLLHLHLSPLQIFAWLSVAGLLGVLLAVPLRRHFIEEEDLPFADGTAAGETLLVLDEGAREAAPRLAALGAGALASGAVAALRDLAGILPEALPLPGLRAAAGLRIGAEVGLLSVGAGMLIGLRVTLSMALGMALAWFVAPGPLLARGLVRELTFNAIVRGWMMWPATGLMISGGLTALVLQRRAVARSFRGLARGGGAERGDFPLRWVVAGVAILAPLLAVIQRVSLGFPLWLTAVSLLLSAVLMLVGIRVLGETNWAPISSMANVMQAVFAVLAPGHMGINMIGSGMSGTVASCGETLMQDYRAGQIVGSTSRNLTILQLVGVPIGALAVAVTYPALVARYGIGDRLPSPISQRWAGFAELLGRGLSTLPASAVAGLGIAVLLGAALTVAERSPRLGRLVPSPTAIGLGMLIPAWTVVPMVVGAAAQRLWGRVAPRSEARLAMPLASGLITGEALVVLWTALRAAFLGG